MGIPDVEEAVISPMLSAFPAPTHVRGDSVATEVLLDVYRRALSRFDRPVLEQAWQKVAAEQDYWVWPMPETLVKAAERFQSIARRANSTDGDSVVEKAYALADEYTKRFMKTTQTAVRAREGGYEAELKRYVSEAANVQAQLILRGPQSGVGYTGHVLFAHHGARDRPREQEWFAAQREQVARGSIRVHVPKEALERWKELAKQQGQER
jgi:hypothetical protein